MTPTFHGNFSGPDQVAFVAHEDDGNVFGLACASQCDAELRGRVEAGAVGDGVNNDIGAPDVKAVVLGGDVLPLLTGGGTETSGF